MVSKRQKAQEKKSLKLLDKYLEIQKANRIEFLSLLIRESNGVLFDTTINEYIVILRENYVADLYKKIKSMSLLNMLVYLKKQLAISKDDTKPNKRINEYDFYFHWYTRLVEIMVAYNPIGKTSEDADGHAGWIIKQLGRGGNDKPTTIAYANTLRKMWLYGQFSKEHKEYVKMQLDELGMATKGYGTLKIK